MPMPLAMSLPLSIFAKDKYRMRAAQSQETARYILEERERESESWKSVCFSVSQAKYKVDSTCRSYRICDPTNVLISLSLWSQRDNDVAIRVDNLFIFIRMCQLASFQWAYTRSGGDYQNWFDFPHLIERHLAIRVLPRELLYGVNIVFKPITYSGT